MSNPRGEAKRVSTVEDDGKVLGLHPRKVSGFD